MKNINYNLIKLLHGKLDDLWRIEKFYLKDAQKAKCGNCQKILKEIQKGTKRHLEILVKEIGSHYQKKKFN